MLGFKNATDHKIYEEEHDERATQHGKEELDYTTNRSDLMLFDCVRYGVLIAGFKHYHKKDDSKKVLSRKINLDATAGYCGQLYTTELANWCREPRVELIITAFQTIEVLYCRS
jgi:hypothetical protein